MTTPFSPSILRGSELDTLKEERRLAHELGETLRSFESSAEDAETLRQVTLALEEPFLLVVAGEFNAGKSAFINALIGEPVLTEGVTPTTAHITLLRHGETPGSRLRPDGIEEIWHPGRLPARCRHRGYTRHQRRAAPPRGANQRVRPAQ